MDQSHTYCQLIIVIDQDDNPELENQINSLEIPRLKTFIQKNAGQSAARNLGIKNSEASFVALLDHDDYWLPNHLELLAKAAVKSPNSALYFSGVSYLNLEGNLSPAESNAAIFERNNLGELLSSNLMVWPSSMLLSKELLGPTLRFNPKYRGYEDDDLLIRISIAGKKIQPDVEHRTTVIRDHESRHSYAEGMGDSASLFEAEYADLAKSLHIANAFNDRFLGGSVHFFRKFPNQRNKVKLFAYIDGKNSKGYISYLKFFRFLPPKPLGILVNVGTVIRKFLK